MDYDAPFSPHLSITTYYRHLSISDKPHIIGTTPGRVYPSTLSIGYNYRLWLLGIEKGG
jgi:hypothetical protein